MISKLDIGSGINPQEGFIHLDILPSYPHVEVVANCSFLPFKDSSFEYVRASHVVEHLNIDDGVLLLREIGRVLHKDGTAEIVIPDFLIFTQLWETLSPLQKLREDVQRIIMGEGREGMFHRTIYDSSMVVYLMVAFGLSIIRLDHTTRGPRDTIIYGMK